MDNLRKALEFGGILTQEDLDYVLPFYRTIDLDTNDHFLDFGAISKQIGFVDKGILRSYDIDKYDSEVTKYFIRQGQFVVDLESFYNNSPSESAIQAVVPTRIYAISRSNWSKVSEEIPKLFILSKSLTEATLLNKIKDNDFLNYGTARDKYEAFLKRYPDLATQLPQHLIASYLKITPQSLSRLRKQLAQRR
jgi:CRP-like cAMP-binding protein